MLPPVLSHPKSVLLDSGLVTGKANEEHFHETSLRPLLCDMLVGLWSWYMNAQGIEVIIDWY